MKRDERVTDEDVRIANDPALAEFLWQEANADIGSALRKARDARNMLQSQVAKLMGVQQSRVSQIETAKGVGMTLDVLARYVAALGYRLDVDVIDPENDNLVSSLPVVPMSFMSVEEVEKRSTVTSVSMQLAVSAHSEASLPALKFDAGSVVVRKVNSYGQGFGWDIEGSRVREHVEKFAAAA